MRIGRQRQRFRPGTKKIMILPNQNVKGSQKPRTRKGQDGKLKVQKEIIFVSEMPSVVSCWF